MSPNQDPALSDSERRAAAGELLKNIDQIAVPKKTRGEKPLRLHDWPKGRRRDFRVLFFGGNSLFLAAIIFCSQYLGGLGEMAVISFWVFYNLMLIYILFVVMSRY